MIQTASERVLIAKSVSLIAEARFLEKTAQELSETDGHFAAFLWLVAVQMRGAAYEIYRIVSGKVGQPEKEVTKWEK